MHFNNRKKLVKAFLKNNKKASRNLMIGAAVIAGTIGGLTTVNQAHVVTAASTQTSTKRAKSSVKVAKLTKKTYLYNKSGKRAGKKALKKNKTIKIYGLKTIKGKTYYSLGHGKYVLASHVKIAKSAKVAKKSYLYIKSGKRAGKKVLKAGKTVNTYGTKTIKGKTYYALGNGKYVLAKNVELTDNNTTAPSPTNESNSSKPSGNTSGSNSSTTNGGSSTNAGTPTGSNTSNGGSSSSTGTPTGSNTANNSNTVSGVSGQCDLTYDPSTKTLHIAAGKDGDTLSNEKAIANTTDRLGINSDDVQTISIDSSISLPSNANFMFGGFENVTEIKGLNKVDTSNTTDMSLMFSDDISLKSLDLSNFDTRKVINMDYMFDMNTSDDNSNIMIPRGSLTELNLSNFNTSQVKYMSGMFKGNLKLKNLNISNFDTSNVTNMHQMFAADPVLTSLDLSDFDTSNVTDMHQMFAFNKSLTSLNVSSFDTSKVTSMASMFHDDINLRNLDVNNFDTHNVKSMIAMFHKVPGPISGIDHFDFSSINDGLNGNASNYYNMFNTVVAND